jgi:hypothetical protein
MPKRTAPRAAVRATIGNYAHPLGAFGRLCPSRIDRPVGARGSASACGESDIERGWELRTIAIARHEWAVALPAHDSASCNTMR